MRSRRSIALAIAVVVGASLAAPASAAAAPPGGTGAAAAVSTVSASATGRWHDITLITGDRVRFRDGSEPIAVRLPTPGRERVAFRTHTADGRLHAVPADAEPLLAAGRLDRRLFDLTSLVAAGHADTDRDTTPILVTARAGADTRAAATAVASLRAVTPDVAAAAIPKRDAAVTWPALRDAPTVDRIWLDGVRTLTLEHSAPQIGAPAAHAAGFTGAGVSVAVLDSGIDATHPDLAGRVAAARNFTGEPDGDLAGHGTHVASIVGGTGAASGGRNRGVAYDATLLDGKVCEQYGCPESAILAGMEWAAAEMGADIVNLSLDGPDSPGDDPLEAAIDRLTAEHGTIFVVAAGNNGAPGGVGSPSTADAALSVGAVDRDDVLAPFSSRGPRHDGAIKPEITAPGVEIVAAAATGTADDPYIAASGTSMATPHVAGAAALLAQQHPGWRGEQLKAALVGSARSHGAATVFDEGAGRVDVAAAIGADVLAEPAVVSFGRTDWPHDDDEPLARPVTLTNTGPADVTFALTIEAAGPGGAVPPAGMFTVDTPQVTVPAGGATTVTLTADTSAGGPDGRYGGRLVATAAGDTLAVPFGVDQDIERRELTIEVTGLDGAPASGSATAAGLDTGELVFFDYVDGTGTARLAPGRYLVEATVLGGDALTTVVAPNVDLTSPVVLPIDARDARPVDITVPHDGVQQVLLTTGVAMQRPDRGFGMSITVFEGTPLRTLSLGDPAPGLAAEVKSTWAVPSGSGDYAGSPELDVTIDFRQDGHYYDGLARRLRPRDFAEVTAVHHGRTGEQAMRSVYGVSPATTFGFSLAALYELPSSRLERYAAPEGASWSTSFTKFSDAGQVELYADGVTWRRGQRGADVWNRPVFGPTLPTPPHEALWATRHGDDVVVGVPLYGDRDGHAGEVWGGPITTRVLRDGEVVAEAEGPFVEFTAPPEPARYRVEVAADTGEPLTSAIALAWEFDSAHVDGDTPRRLPVTAARHTPRLDDAGSAPGGVPFLVPVRLERQGLPVSDVRRVLVDVSYDDGVTWRRAPLLGLGSRQVRAAELDAESLRGVHSVALLWHPRGPGFVSLRTTTFDRHGNTGEQTLLRAYALR